ncbi:DUF1631 family protein [Mangrovimicrobium sediminis]|uniref:DUF1631 family protein n=1 Tax=Mangrovimicrobium sediminis TaxID=2562682 RepID=A0A4Z0M5I2_9GAMM|nr:DUF1631 family protein [Haliea sp. SAOS-164]TGD74565.1 DUF1631 family protein [Haliea sp. SAOS-164]
MSPPQTQTQVFPALLVLEDGAKLSGECSATEALQLQLSRVKLLAGTSASGRVRLKQGMPATLNLIDRQDLGPLPVTIGGITGGVVYLAAADSRGDKARRWKSLFDDKPVPRVKASDLQGASTAYTRILRGFHQSAMQELSILLPEAINHIHSDLMSLASRIKPSSDGRNRVYEAAVSLGRNRERIGRLLLEQIENYFQKLVPGPGEDEYWQQEIEGPEELDLVDLDEFEGHLALNRTVTMAEELHRIPLEALTIRLAELIGAEPLAVRLPIHARQLCRAFQNATETLEVAPETAPVVYEYYSQHVVRPLGDFYAAMNNYLAENGLAPELEREIQTKGSLLKRARLNPNAARPVQDQATSVPEEIVSQLRGALGQQPTGGDPPPGGFGHGAGAMPPLNVYQSVVDALNFRREAEGLANGEALASGVPLSGTWDGATIPSSDVDQSTLVDAATIARALAALQRDSGVRQAVREAQSLREYLAQHRQQINSLRDSSGLTTDSLNQLDMVDNLFGTISSQIDVAPELKPTLASLQIPLARLALLDPEFFLDHGHVARAVVDRLSTLATSANFPNRALETRINRVVEEIVESYETDESVFERALQEVEKLGEQQDRALSRNIERVVRIQDGQEKVQQARLAVSAVINERIRPPAAPRVLLDLVEAGWRDVLVLTHVKEGPESATWAEQIKTLDQLSGWLEDKQAGDDDEDMLMQRSLEAETLIDVVEQQLATALPTNIAYQPVLAELRGILAGSQDVATAEVSDSGDSDANAPQRLRARVEDLPRLRRWVKRVEQLQRDSWLTYRGADGQRRRMQLAWVSPAKDRYIFVNERGQKIADLSAVQLARKLSQGVQPPAPADRLPVVDKSMYQTLEHVQKTLSFSRNHDSLTRLINGETFLDQMNRALRHAQLKNSQHAVLYLDIDKFALVNELYDKVNGDEVLMQFSRLLAQLHGKKSSSARIENDRFAVLLLDRSAEQAMRFAEKVRTDIEASSIEIEGEQVSFTVSIGLAPILEFSPSVDQVLESARSASQAAKQAGGNCVRSFDEDQGLANQFRTDKSRTRQDLEQALATDRFVLRAQPIIQVAVSGQQAVGRHYELLLGLTNPDGSIASPEEFIRSAERYGFMTLVDRWVVREAFAWVSQLMDAQKEVPYLAINLSGGSVTDDEFLEYLLEQISEFGVGTSRICFEITETGTISNLVKAADFVRAFRNIGCKFSIDDFGTGLASHNYLRELPVDFVKIDGTFITGIHTNRADYAMARSINDLAHFLGQETIAESVENDEIIAKLEEIGVDYLQGWGVARPRLLTEITDELSSIVK